MAIKKDLGIVLRGFDFRNTSKIAHILTRENGKINGIFKGIRAGKKNFTTPLNTFSLNEFIFYESRSELWLVSFADLVDDYLYLRTNLQKHAVANYIAELSNKILALHHPCKDIFNLVSESFSWLRNDVDRKLLYIFQIKILELSGFRPHLTDCIKCLRPIKKKAYFSVSLGGFLCPECRGYDVSAKGVYGELLRSLRYVQNNDLRRSLRLVPSRQTEYSIFNIIEGFLKYHLDAKIKSFSSVLNV